MNVVGLDLSLAATGIATEHGTSVVESKQRRGVERLVWIRDEINTTLYPIPGNNPAIHLVALEDLPFGARNNAAGPLGMIHGVIRVALHERGVPIVVIPPASLKRYGAGRGNATKADLRMELFKRTELDIRDDNAVDAYWLRAMTLDHYGLPVVQMPQAHRAGLDGVDWPEVRA